VPASLRAPVPPVALPAPNATAGDVWNALNGQTAQLQTADDHIQTLGQLADLCAAQQAKLTAALVPKKRFWLF
jgi:hypothetical protein